MTLRAPWRERGSAIVWVLAGLVVIGVIAALAVAALPDDDDPVIVGATTSTSTTSSTTDTSSTIADSVTSTTPATAAPGPVGQANTAACASDRRSLETAEEAYLVEYGGYGDEAALVASGLIAEPSELHDITLVGGDTDYELVPTAACA